MFNSNCFILKKIAADRPPVTRGKLPRLAPEAVIYTRPKEILSKVGITGQKITCEVNYFRMAKTPEWNIYHYRVDFNPEVFDDRVRRRLISLQREMLGGYLFDGTQVFITQLLDADIVTRVVEVDETKYEVTFRLTRMVDMTEGHALQIMNLILRRAMDGLHLETVGRNKYDPDAAVSGL